MEHLVWKILHHGYILKPKGRLLVAFHFLSSHYLSVKVEYLSLGLCQTCVHIHTGSSRCRCTPVLSIAGSGRSHAAIRIICIQNKEYSALYYKYHTARSTIVPNYSLTCWSKLIIDDQILPNDHTDVAYSRRGFEGISTIPNAWFYRFNWYCNP